MDVVIDTDVLSTFIKINKLELLQRLFTKASILLTPTVYRELRAGERQGIIRFALGKRFSRISLEQAEKRIVKEMVSKGLSRGDSECIAVAQLRKCLLVTNDTDVKKEAARLSIDYVDLPSLLRMLWKSNIMSKSQVSSLMGEIEKKDSIVIKNKGLILR